ncbi:MAG: hypothetical protein ABIQ95_07425 [Bdellovibrionia bacterium]
MNIFKKTVFQATIALTIVTGVALNPSRADPMETMSVQKTDSSTSTMGCIVSLLKSLYSSVPGLYFKYNCAHDRETDRYRWEFIYKNNIFTGESDTSMEFCISDLSTELNLNIPIIDISLNHRCQRNERDERDPFYFWKYDLKFDQDRSNY